MYPLPQNLRVQATSQSHTKETWRAELIFYITNIYYLLSSMIGMSCGGPLSSKVYIYHANLLTRGLAWSMCKVGQVDLCHICHVMSCHVTQYYIWCNSKSWACYVRYSLIILLKPSRLELGWWCDDLHLRLWSSWSSIHF